MKNIVYFTTAQEYDDFTAFSKLWSSPINASNQLFHNKMIRALSLSNHVDVISIRPFSKQKCKIKYLDKGEKISSLIHWHYLKVKGGRITKFASILSQARRLTRKINKNNKENDIIYITDTINPTVLAVASALAKQNKKPLIGICTDSPSNITGTKRSYTLLLLQLAKRLNGYICLTPSLNDLFNENNHPNIILEGLVENVLPSPKDNKYGKYFFYSGALHEKYGIFELIKAFNKLNNKDYKLVICGHHEDAKFLEAIRNNQRIKYLGILPNKEVIRLEQKAVANINPRPYSEDLDRFSVPSKVLEYLNSGTIVVSSNCSRIKSNFNDEIIWINNGDEQDIYEGLKYVINLDDNKKKAIEQNAFNKVQKLYSLNNVNIKLNQFLEFFTKKN